MLTLPGRKCANGRDVPISNADWPKFVQGLRDAAAKAYNAAQAKSQAGILDGFDLSREEAEAIVMQARLKAGWISEADLAPPATEEPATEAQADA